MSTNKDLTSSQAQLAREAGVTIYAVGVSNVPNVGELKGMSSAPQKYNENYYLADDFNSLTDIVGHLVSGNCPTGK